MILLRPRKLRWSDGSRHPIAKVTRAEREANRRARQELTRSLEPLFVDVFEAFRTDVDREVRDRLASSAVIGVPADAIVALEGSLALQLDRALQDAILRGSQVGLQFSGIEGVSVSPEIAREAGRRFIATTGSRQIQQINTTTRRGVRRILAQAQQDALTLEDAAQRIGQRVGLTSRQSQSLDLFQETLFDNRVRIVQREAFANTVRGQAAFDEAIERALLTVDRDVELRRGRMVRDRARLIVENEIALGVQHGERVFWEEAIRQNETNADTLLKRWFTVGGPNVCPICRPLHGQIAKFNESFSSLSFIGPSPPAHIRCHCFLEYAPAGEFAGSRAGG